MDIIKDRMSNINDKPKYIVEVTELYDFDTSYLIKYQLAKFFECEEENIIMLPKGMSIKRVRV